ncbi:MAG: hypothetical protein BYD32DRAFT_436479 [Podila humilis]|nr:MAG: hypothetical protein BYD32DRAFT_436479 [Podila humilis]
MSWKRASGSFALRLGNVFVLSKSSSRSEHHRIFSLSRMDDREVCEYLRIKLVASLGIASEEARETLEVIKAQQSVSGGRHASIGYISGRMNASVIESVYRSERQRVRREMTPRSLRKPVGLPPPGVTRPKSTPQG